MKVSESTIAFIVKRGDTTTVYEIIRRLTIALNERSNGLSELRQNYEKLKRLYTATELDRDRFRLIARQLIELCDQRGLSEAARTIARRQGGFPDEKGQISIDLE